MKTLTIRLQDELAGDLAEAAVVKGESVNGLVTRLLSDYCYSASTGDSKPPNDSTNESRLTALELQLDDLEKVVRQRLKSKQVLNMPMEPGKEIIFGEPEVEVVTVGKDDKFYPAIQSMAKGKGKESPRHPTLGERSSKNELPRRGVV